jgi:chloramphenicol 3-O phosphotransferase
LAAAHLSGLPVLLVGVHCPIDVILERRAAASGHYATATADGEVPEPVRRWQVEVHRPGLYDLSVDTATMSAAECAARIRARLEGPAPSALSRLA